jgi:type IV pilus assembly protein PilA
VSEAVLATSQCRTAVSEIYQTGTGNMTANNWGCGEKSGGVTQYVDAIATTDNGAITVTTSANTALGAAASKTLRLTPVDSSGTALVYSAPSNVQVSGFKCQPGTMPPKYLPGSCR